MCSFPTDSSQPQGPLHRLGFSGSENFKLRSADRAIVIIIADDVLNYTVLTPYFKVYNKL